MKPSRALQGSLIAAAMLAVAGCVTETLTPDAGQTTTLFVTRAGDTASIGWISRADLAYTILYSNGRSSPAAWQIVPGGANIEGTGEQITFTDPVPKDEIRYYRLQIEKKK